MYDSTNNIESPNKIVIKLKRSASQASLKESNSYQKIFSICSAEKNKVSRNKKKTDTDRSKTDQSVNSKSLFALKQESMINLRKKQDKVLKQDQFCWICHFDVNLISCNTCQRKFHRKCLTTQNIDNQDPALPNWICHECQTLTAARNEQKILKNVTPSQFYTMLNNAVRRLKYAGTEPFQTSVDSKLIPDYFQYIVNPMDLSVMEKKIAYREYICLEEAIQDMKWLVHNCNVFNGAQSRLTSIAKSMFRMFKHEVNEIEVCCDCYLSSIKKNNENWFADPCKVPHLLVYAKAKGFPYWPAKALRATGRELDVRFFGAHDRALVPIEKCYWLSKDPPLPVKNYQSNIQRSLIELELHIERLKDKFGDFNYAEPLSPINLNNPHIFLPELNEIKCLTVMTDNLKNGRSRRSAAMNNPNKSSSVQLHSDSSLSNESAQLNEDVLEKKKRISRLTKRSSITNIESSATRKSEEKLDGKRLANSSLKHNEEALSEIKANKSESPSDNQNDKHSNISHDISQLGDVKRSSRVRKCSSKYLNFSVSNAASKRKSNSMQLDTSLNQDPDNSNNGANIPSDNSNPKRVKTEESNKSENEFVSDSLEKNTELLKNDLALKISDPNEPDIVIVSNEQTDEFEEDRDERIKELRRIEKVLLEEKKQLELLEKEQVEKLEQQKLDNKDKDLSKKVEENLPMKKSPLKTKVISPIRIKISLNSQDLKTTTSVLTGSNGTSPEPSNQSINEQGTSLKETNLNESLRLNLGELVKNLKANHQYSAVDKKIQNNNSEVKEKEEKVSKSENIQCLPNVDKILPVEQLFSIDQNSDSISEVNKNEIINEKTINKKVIDTEISESSCSSASFKTTCDASTKQFDNNSVKSDQIEQTMNEESNPRSKDESMDFKVKESEEKFNNDNKRIWVDTPCLKSYQPNEYELTKSVSQQKYNIETFKKFQEMKDLQNKKCLDEMRYTYEQLINEIKYNSELKIREILQESIRERKKMKLEYEKKIAETKQKQWCANCGKESIYYCCWNTSYCDEECQKNPLD